MSRDVDLVDAWEIRSGLAAGVMTWPRQGAPSGAERPAGWILRRALLVADWSGCCWRSR